jgi:hypothetical protein
MKSVVRYLSGFQSGNGRQLEVVQLGLELQAV